MDSPLIFYLRDEPRPFDPPKSKPERKRKRPPVELKIGTPQGRPVVSVAAVEVPAIEVAAVEVPAIEVPSPSSAAEEMFWVHFCVASCGPVDLGEVEYRAPDPGFAKNFGRQVALDRLAKRRTVTTFSRVVNWKGERKTYSQRVGAAIPISSAQLGNPTDYRGAVIRRVITEHIAEDDHNFPPTARTLAKQWLKGQPRKYATSGGVELTEELLVNLAEEAEKGYAVSQLRQRQPTEG